MKTFLYLIICLIEGVSFRLAIVQAKHDALTNRGLLLSFRMAIRYRFMDMKTFRKVFRFIAYGSDLKAGTYYVVLSSNF